MESPLVFSPQKNKEQRYAELLPQIKSLVASETDRIANMSNVAAGIHSATGYLWVGFYLVKGRSLVLGPFHGPIACTRIQKGKGVCGVAWAKKETQIVSDVSKFPNHIACSSKSKSEIVVPRIENGQVAFVLDIDSDQLNTFDTIDADFFKKIVTLL